MQQNILIEKADQFAHAVYDISAYVPAHERFGFLSQLRRAALSVPLNIVEGYARQSKKEFRRFLLIAYGSYKETKYLLDFGYKRNYFKESSLEGSNLLIEEVGKLLWTFIKKLEE